jgi:cyclopropane-fatty-acyl-phospholipid synthase
MKCEEYWLAGLRWQRKLSRLGTKLGMQLLGKVGNRLFRRGSLTIIAPDGFAQRIGDGVPSMTVRILDAAFVPRLLFDPELALGEAYVAGALALEGGDVFALMEMCYANLGFSTELGPLRFGAVARRVIRRISLRAGSSSARANVAHHYDHADALYELFLDADRQYSCAYFAQPGDTLEVAQDRKKLHIAAKLLLRPGQRILDIGSGWGGLATYIAQTADVDVTGVTLSKSQHAYSVRHTGELGLTNRVHFLLEDYFQHSGRYERVVSVGMLEHVGAAHFDAYFGKVRDLLEDGGVAVIHTIGRADGPGSPNPWINRYIFPGGYIPALSEIVPSIERAGLYVTDIEILRLHYAQTLNAWRRRFYANRKQIAALYDERFCRMWEFYLAASEAAFRRHGGLINFQIQLSNRIDAIPLIRDYMLDWERAHGSGLTKS